MKKLIGSRKDRVNAAAQMYLTYKALAENQLKALKEELKDETECETDQFRFSYKTTSRRQFSKDVFVEKFGEDAYDQCRVAKSMRRFDLKKKE